MKSQPTSCRYSTAATKPARSSCASVPVSKRPATAPGCGPHLVGAPAFGELPADVREAQVRPVELVGRAEQHVGPGRLDVDRPVRSVVHGVDPGECARVVRKLCDHRDGRHRSDTVGGPRKGDDARPVGEQGTQMAEVEAALVVHLAEAHDQVPVVRELEPRRDVAVMVEPRADDLVACPPLARGGAREREVQRRHVGSECDLLAGRAEEPCCGRSRVGDQRVRSA